MSNAPIIFGEVLFDQFPDGSNILGGAPFNVAWHLHGFGLQPVLVSAVGLDESGEQVLQSMTSWGMNTDHIQQLPAFPTGKVSIELENGQPSFSILDQQAYDYIHCEDGSLGAGGKTPLLYHGSLATRHETSRQALSSIHQLTNAPIFMDVNLRPPWWSHADVTALIGRARWIKLNEHELAQLFHCDSLPAEQWITKSQELMQDSSLELIILTKGEHGAVFVTRDSSISGDPVKVSNIVDTVGAGDAFSAVTILGLLSGWAHELILHRALEFASLICSQRGATAMNRDLYKGSLESWQK